MFHVWVYVFLCVSSINSTIREERGNVKKYRERKEKKKSDIQ